MKEEVEKSFTKSWAFKRKRNPIHNTRDSHAFLLVEKHFLLQKLKLNLVGHTNT
jgi:hypothetical protein